MRVAEQLNKISKLREDFNQTNRLYEEGKGAKPEIEEATIDMMERMVRNINGDHTAGSVSIAESITSTDTIKLIPKVIEGQLREAAEPEYLGTNYMQKVQFNAGNTAVYVIPIVGELNAYEVGESTRYKEDGLEMGTIENSTLEIRVKKIGLKVSITEEAITDSSWDILGITIRKMGRAMARYKEETIFKNFSNHGWTLMDNLQRQQNPDAGTRGCAEDGSFNDTLSVEDFLDMVMALMAQGFQATNVILHPLTWVVFARNSMLGNGLSFGAFGGQNVHPWGAVQGTPGFAGLSADGSGQKMIMGPDQVQGRLPMPLQIDLSPNVRFDKEKKRFDMYCIDRNEVGVLVEREALSTDNWTDPERDLRLLKVKERYGVGIQNNGRAIMVVKNLAVAPSYPKPPVVTVKTTT